LIQQPGAPSPVYRLQNRITNRTGTRYRQQRYDRAQDIIPDCWLYDIADPGRYDLPEWFYLDARSQIAPGLITQYSASMDMAYNYSESFRLYPFQGAQTPRELQLTSQKVRGMTAYGTPVDGQAVNGTSPWTVTAFHMTFADVTGDGNTEREISGFVGGRPIMPPEAYSFTEAADDNSVPAGTLNAFTLSADVPEVPAASSNDAALLPIHVRLRLSRRDVGIQEWEALESAENALGKFAETRTIRVHSPKAPEKGDLNLLQAAGGAAGRCVQAFTHGDFLYIDFIVLVADAKSRKGGNETAFCEVVEDGGIPYILIGDGESDGKWVLSFYIGPAGSDPNDDPGTPANGDSGGGCSAGLLPFVFVLPALPVLPRFRKIILSR
jgi:hypothetical protein